MDKLKQLFAKRNITGYEGLTEMERATYKKWEATLQKEFRAEDFTKFLEAEIARLRESRECNEKHPQDEYIRGRIQNYKAILAVMSKPEQERKLLELQIDQLIKN